MRILFSVDHLGPGGAQRQAVELAIELRRFAEVSLCTYHSADFHLPRLQEASIPVRTIGQSTLRQLDPTQPIRLSEHIRSLRPDLVQAFLAAPSFRTLLATLLLPKDQRPALVVGERSQPELASRREKIVQGSIYQRSTAITANSTSAVATIARNFGVAPNKIHYIPNGIRLRDFDRRADEASPVPLRAGQFNIVMLGRLDPVKNHGALLDALTLVPPRTRERWDVSFVGASTTHDGFSHRLLQRIEALGLVNTVRVMPTIENVPALLARADVLVLTSTREGFPNVVLEAMAARICVVAARVGDVPSMIEDDRSGFLLDGLAPQCIADRLLQVFELGAPERRRCGEQARAIVEQRYSMEKVAESYLQLYEQLTRAGQV